MNGHHHTRPYYRTFSPSLAQLWLWPVFSTAYCREKGGETKIEGRAHTKRRHTRPEGENERKICEKNIIITSNPHYSRSLEFIYIMIIEPSSNPTTPLVKTLIALFPGQLFTWFWRHLFRLKSESKMSRQDSYTIVCKEVGGKTKKKTGGISKLTINRLCSCFWSSSSPFVWESD